MSPDVLLSGWVGRGSGEQPSVRGMFVCSGQGGTRRAKARLLRGFANGPQLSSETETCSYGYHSWTGLINCGDSFKFRHET